MLVAQCPCQSRAPHLSESECQRSIAETDQRGLARVTAEHVRGPETQRLTVGPSSPSSIRCIAYANEEQLRRAEATARQAYIQRHSPAHALTHRSPSSSTKVKGPGRTDLGSNSASASSSEGRSTNGVAKRSHDTSTNARDTSTNARASFARRAAANEQKFQSLFVSPLHHDHNPISLYLE